MQAYEKVKQQSPHHSWEGDPWAGFSRCHVVLDRQVSRPLDWLDDWPEELNKEFWEIWQWIEQESKKEGLSMPMALESVKKRSQGSDEYHWSPDRGWGEWRVGAFKWVRIVARDMKDWSVKDDEMVQALGLHVYCDVENKGWAKEDRYRWLEEYGLAWMSHRRYRFWVFPTMDLIQIQLEEMLLKQLGFSGSLSSEISLRGWDLKKAKEAVWRPFCLRVGSIEAFEVFWVAVILAKEGLIKSKNKI